VKIAWKSITIKELAAFISRSLDKKGIDAILVGGACVSIYTKNKYQSFDLDFVTHAAVKEGHAEKYRVFLKRMKKV